MAGRAPGVFFLLFDGFVAKFEGLLALLGC
jgi:hypothetical protein